MKTVRNLVFIILLICSLGVISSKGKKSKSRVRSFIQQSTQSLTTSSYLSAPASSEGSGCFFDTSKHLIETLTTKITKYSQICNLEAKSELKGIKDLLKISKKLGQIKGAIRIYPNYTLTLEDKQVLTSSVYPEINLLDITDDIIKKIIETNLKVKWEKLTKENGYPVFMREKSWILAQYQFAIEYLTVGFPNGDECLPVTEDIKNIIDLVVIDLNEEGTALTVKEIYERFEIDPYQFEYGGYALAFWLKEDNTELNSPSKLIQGFIDNKEELNFGLECCRVNHILKVGEANYNIRTSPTCVEYAFVLITFEKDCDSYLMNVIVRQSHSNKRYSFQAQNITASIMENLQLTISTSKIVMPYLFNHFKYSESEELRVFSLMASPFFEKLKNSISRCDGSDEGCEYYKDSCQVCNLNWYLYKGKCWSQCPDGTYVKDSERCEPCEEGCKHCSDEETCEECDEEHFLYQGDCFTTCPSGTYAVGRKCRECTPNCKWCSSESECGECNNGFYLYNKKCYEECPSQTFLDISSSNCKDCPSHCLSCKGVNTCDSCDIETYLFEEKECRERCPIGYREDSLTRKCKKCPVNCDYCSEDNKCDSCSDKYHLSQEKQCLSDCPHFQVSINKVCVPCGDHENCEACYSTNINQCLKCKSPKVLGVDKRCYDSCGDGYYADENGVCQPCRSENCKVCSKDECLICDPKKVLFEKDKCLDHCPDKYIDIDGICQPCKNKQCKTCLEDLNTCNRCDYPQFLLKEGDCVSECGDYYYQDQEDCKQCVEGCLSCVDKYSCDLCDIEDGYYYKDGYCTKDCGEGYRYNANGYCEKCTQTHCASCMEDAMNCDYCEPWYLLYNNFCYKEKCPVGTYKPNQESKKCNPCKNNCDSCSTSDTCDSCTAPFVLQGSECYKECNDFYYPDSNRICHPCKNTRCKKCYSSPDTCNECSDDMFLYEGDCVEKCPSGTFVNGRICEKCDGKCKACEKTKDNCTSCISGLFFDIEKLEKCVPKCDEGKVQVGEKCENCKDKNCKVCKPENLSCCVESFPSFVVDECKVKEKCPSKKYSNNRVCTSCISNCDICEDSEKCKECSELYFLLNGVCVKQCGTGYIGFEKKCYQCGTKCNKCQHDNVNHCTECPPNRYLLDGDCLSDCGSGYWNKELGDDIGGECKNCDDSFCDKCEDYGKTCKKCKNGYVLYNKQCKPEPCPEGTKNIGGVCVDCSVSNCKKCEISTKNCDICLDTFTLVSSVQCDKECPTKTFKNLFEGYTNSYFCDDCPSNCDECENKSTCKKCSQNYYLQGDKCQKACDEGYYADGKVCKKCKFDNCKECSSTDCFKCSDEWYLYDDTESSVEDKCFKECPEKTYHDNTTYNCKNCGKHCKRCLDGKTCTICDDEYLLVNNSTCSDECPDGTVDINGKCTLCQTDQKCLKCDKDLKTCNKCGGELLLLNNKCVESCGNGYYAENGICKPCITNCKSCRNGKQCDRCNPQYFLFENECYQSCGDGYYGADGECRPCLDNCRKCSNHDTCDECDSSFLLQDNKCTKSCSTGYFQFDTRQCKKCPDNCLKCTTIGKCDVCEPKYYNSDGLCTTGCVDGQLPDGDYCVKCVDDCQQCGTTKNECNKCKPGFYRYLRKCVSKCPAKYYPNDKTQECEKCKSHCDVCTNGDTCAQCEEEYSLFENNCISSCPEGYSSFNRVCEKCGDVNCNECPDDVEKCKVCRQPYNLYKDVCKYPCPDKTYSDLTTQTCKDCLPDCKTCSNGNSCDSCGDELYLEEGRCVDKCSDGFAPVNGKCEECQVENCKTCDSSNLKKCFACRKGKYLKIYEAQTTECTSNCGEGYYAENEMCKPCSNNCETCSDGNTCKLCLPGYVLYDKKCIEKCPQFYMERNKECFKCEGSNCLDCDNMTLKKCKKCLIPYKLQDEECVDECKPGYYDYEYDKDNFICLACQANCEKCTSSTSCKKCNPGYSLHNGECIKGCPNKFVDVDGICKPCGPNCASCSSLNQTICDSCLTGYFLNDKYQCGSCGEGYLGVNGKCEPCSDKKCRKCNPAKKCLRCYDDEVILNDECYGKNCPEGYYEGNDFLCSECGDSKRCSECQPLNPQRCKKCKDKYYLLDYGCVENCPPGYFANNNRVCQKCSSNCLSCIDDQQCLVCDEDFALDGNKKCVDCDQVGQVKVNGECKKCEDEKCAKCEATNLKICKECDKEYVLYKGNCIQKCPPGTFLSGRECQDCEENCVSCLDQQICLSCNSQTVLHKNDCLSKCPSNYVSQNGKCKKCYNSHCEECDSNNLAYCKKCEAPLILFNGNCLEECDLGYYYDEGIKTCKQCKNHCISCTSDQDCLECDWDYLLYPPTQECLEICPDQYYVNQDFICEHCPRENCQKCCRGDPDFCMACLPGFYKLFGTGTNAGKPDCVKECPNTHYLSGDTCKTCPGLFKTCKGPDEPTSCIEPYALFNKTCRGECPEGTAERDGECLYCTQNDCLSCDPKDLSACRVCKKILFEKRCRDNCPKGYYVASMDETNTAKTCRKCPPHCQECLDGETCKVCEDGYYFWKNTSECVLCETPNLLISDVCTNCKVSGCAQCVETDPNICSICDGKFVLHEGKCLNSCPSGFYRDGNVCIQCSSKGCIDCSKKDHCNKCDPPLVLMGSVCQDKCIQHFRVNDGNCDECADKHCLVCDEAKDNCTECEVDYYVYQNQCVSFCPSGTRQYKGMCLDCPKDCVTCEFDKCTKCGTGKYLKDGKCVSSCGEKFYGKNGSCFRCSVDKCVSCPDDSCDKCLDGSYLHLPELTCEADCGDGYYGNSTTGRCEKCYAGCKKCFNDNTCEECYPQFSIYNEECVNPCPVRTSSVNGKCHDCKQSSCYKCTQGHPEICEECDDGYYKYEGICVSECGDGTYASGKECKNCDPKCEKCINETTCLDCKDNYFLDEGECKNSCPVGKAKVGEECKPCKSERCKECSNDLQKCYNCYELYYLFGYECYTEEECPVGTYPDEKTGKCQSCAPGCKKCTSKGCDLCKRGYYYHLGKCLENCPEGFFEDCESTSRKCVPCDKSCTKCILGTNEDCITCKPGYFMYENKCIPFDGCPKGRFYDGETCQKCQITYCAECSSENSCTKCNRGFYVENGQCVQGKTLISLINDYILVDSYTSHNSTLRSQEIFEISDYEGTGIGSSEVTFTFYVRSLQPKLENDLVVFSVINNETNTAYDWKFIITAKDSRCKLVIGKGSTYNQVLDICSCTYNELYNWKFFSLTLTKNGADFIALANFFDNNGVLIEKSINVEGQNHVGILEIFSKIILNYYSPEIINPSNAEFQIGKLNILDYYPTEYQLIQLSQYLPTNCDYFCSSCQDVCLSCQNGLAPIDHRCEGNSLVESEPLYINPKEFVIHFRDFVEDFTTDGYGFSQWIYINSIDNLDFLVYRIDIAESLTKVPYITCEIINKQLVYNGEIINHPPFEAQNWYYLYVANTANGTKVILKDTDGNQYNQTISSFTFIRQYIDFIYTIHINRGNENGVTSVLNTKVYINNYPHEEQIEIEYRRLKCSENCISCDHELKCLECIGGFEIEEGVCVEKSPKEEDAVELINIYEFWNTNYTVREVPFTENLTFAFSIIKKTHSNIYQNYTSYNIFSYSDGYTTKPLISEKFLEEYVSEYSVHGKDNKKSWVHDYTEEITDYITFTIVINRYQGTIHYYITDFSVNQRYDFVFDFTDSIKAIIVGDKNGYEMNTEIMNLRVFDGYAGKNLVNTLQQYPKSCQSICSSCDFSTSLCRKCLFSTKSQTICPYGLMRWYPYNSYRTTWNTNPDTFCYSKYGDESVHGEGKVYSIIGYFRAYNLIEGRKHRLTCLNNDNFRVFSPKNNRGHHLICLDIIVRDGLYYLDAIINDGGEFYTMNIENFVFEGLDYVSLIFTVDLEKMKLNYYVEKTFNNTINSEGEYTYIHVPEKLQSPGCIEMNTIPTNVDTNIYSPIIVFTNEFGMYIGKPFLKSYLNSYPTLEKEPDCGNGCILCYYFDLYKKTTSCAFCKKGYKQITNEDGNYSCEKSNDYVELYKGERIINETTYYIKDKSILDSDYSIYFQIQFNYAFWKYNENLPVVEAGNLLVVVSKGKLFVILDNNESTEIPLYDQYNLWNHILITKSNQNLNITVNAGSYSKTVSLTISTRIKFNKVVFKPYGQSLSFYSFALTTATDMSSIKQESLKDCGFGCLLCEEGKCRNCEKKKNDDGTCQNSRSIISSGYYSPEGSTLVREFLVEKSIGELFARIKSWTYQFNIEYLEKSDEDMPFFEFGNLNGITSIASFINISTGKLLIKLWPIDHIENQSEDIVLELPHIPITNYFFFSMSYDNNSRELRVLFGEKKDNYLIKTYVVKGFLGYFGNDVFSLIQSKKSAFITNHEFDYSIADTIDNMISQFQTISSKLIQPACEIGSPRLCYKCKVDVLQSNICIPSSNNQQPTVFSMFTEYKQFNPDTRMVEIKEKFSSLPSYSLTFMFKLAAITTSTLNVLRISSSNDQTLLYIDFEQSSNKFIFGLERLGKFIVVPNVYAKSLSIFDWLSVSLCYNILNGQVQIRIHDIFNNLLYNKVESVGQDYQYYYEGYNFQIGYQSMKSGKFEFGGFEFIGQYIPDEIDNYRFMGIQEVSQGCYQIISGVCIQKMEDTIKIPLTTEKNENSELFSPINPNLNNYYAFNRYLFTIEVDVNKFYEDNNSNNNILVAFTDEVEQVSGFTRRDIIPDDIKRKSLLISIEKAKIKIYTPTLSWGTEYTYYYLDFNSEKFTTNIIINIFADVKRETMSFLFINNGYSHLYYPYFSKDQKIPPISLNTLVYVNPAVSHFTINFNTMGISYPFLKRYKELPLKCVNKNGDVTCPSCDYGFYLFSPGCISEQKDFYSTLKMINSKDE